MKTNKMYNAWSNGRVGDKYSAIPNDHIIKYVKTENDCLKYLITVKKRKLLIYDNKLCYFNLLLLIIVYKR